MEGAILFFSRFPACAGGGGGARREAQLVELLLPLGSRFLSCWDSDYMKGRAKRKVNMATRLTKKLSPNRKYWVDDDSWDYVFDLGAVAREWLDRFGSLKNIRMVILDDPIYFSPLAVHFHRQGIPLVALCQNLESLSLGQLNRKHQFELLQKEIALLKKCSLVVAISREETFFLRNLGMPVAYLPYYPVKAIRERLGKVRENRIHSRKEGYLVLGTAGNKSTLDGMKALIEFWGSPRNSLRDEKLLVAGFWTRKYLPSAPAGNVIILGDITDASLDDLLGTVKALVCFQESGSGALTKIREMLLAGVPVLANAHAARSYHEFNGAGLFEFAGLDDLGRAAGEFHGGMAPPPIPASLAAEQDLLARLRTLSAGNDAPDAPLPAPRVSILLPNLNHRPFLDERMRSIQGQTFGDWELVVVDSQSTDGAWEFFREWAAKDPRIRIFQTPQRGIYVNWNRCIGLARGEYVLIAPSDDTMELDFLEHMVRALDENPDCDLAHCKLRIIDENGDPSSRLNWDRLFSTRFFEDWIDHAHIRRAPFDGVLHCGVRTVYTSMTQLLIRRRLFERVGLFSTRFGPAADFEWGMRASLLADTVHVPRTLAAWRVHERQNTDISKLDAASRKRELIMMVRHAFRAARRIEPKLLRKLRLSELICLYRKERLVETLREARQRSAPMPLPLLRRIGIGLPWLFRDPLVFIQFYRRRRDLQRFLPPLSPIDYPRRLLAKYGLAGHLVAVKGSVAGQAAPPSPLLAACGNNAPNADLIRTDRRYPRMVETALNSRAGSSQDFPQVGRAGDPSPLLIYQMGKVGSSSVYRTLKQADSRHAIFHVHQLSEQGIQRKTDWLKYFDSLQLPRIAEDLQFSRDLRAWIDANRTRVPWKIITMTRDPVSVKLSSFFENIAVYRHEVFDSPQKINIDKVVRTLMNTVFHEFDEKRDYSSSWFNVELEQVFGIDIYSVPYDFARGYTILNKGNVSVVLIRLEDLERSFRPAMADFLLLPDLELIKVNTAKSKSYWNEYQAVLRKFSLSEELFDRIYSSRYARHFYPPAEREKARKKWVRAAALE